MGSGLCDCQALPLSHPSGNLRRMPPPTIFLGLGSNLGDREANLAGAERALEGRGFRVSARSSTYLTEPREAPDQGWFLNAVLGGESQENHGADSGTGFERAMAGPDVLA